MMFFIRIYSLVEICIRKRVLSQEIPSAETTAYYKGLIRKIIYLLQV